MPKIIWCGNKSWDTNFPENTLPNNAKLIERSDICSIRNNIGVAVDACSRSFTWSLL